MDANFWIERWREGRTGFHQDRVTPLLPKYWPSLNLPAQARILVPLCGKTLDMIWLASQGHQVLGVELAEQAIDQFMAENQLQPTVRNTPLGRHYQTGNIEIICGDIFNLDAATLNTCAGAYDRAALIALPPNVRTRYVDHIYRQLAPGYRGLLLTLDYPQEQMDGPPFSVPEAEVQTLYENHSTAKLIDRRDTLAKDPKLASRGIDRLDTLVFELQGAAA